MKCYFSIESPSLLSSVVLLFCLTKPLNRVFHKKIFLLFNVAPLHKFFSMTSQKTIFFMTTESVVHSYVFYKSITIFSCLGKKSKLHRLPTCTQWILRWWDFLRKLCTYLQKCLLLVLLRCTFELFPCARPIPLGMCRSLCSPGALL